MVVAPVSVFGLIALVARERQRAPVQAGGGYRPAQLRSQS
jgi:stage V sporulation protein SpoVS